MDSGGAEKKEASAVEGRREIKKLFYINCQSLINKRAELRVMINNLNPDIICLTECWTNDTIENGLLMIENYELIMRKDRRDTLNGRGGVLIFV